MEQSLNEIKINGVEYVKKDLVAGNKSAKQLGGLDYVIVRTSSAGVFAGYLSKMSGQEAVVVCARRIWYWDGAASLSQLAMEGTSKPETCKFPCEVDMVILTNAIEILRCTEKARESIIGVPVWKK